MPAARTVNEEKPMRIKRKATVIMFALLGLVPIANDVCAVVGMPLTPVSYAGVARRTVRRSYYY
jgi:hypothetical protein